MYSLLDNLCVVWVALLARPAVVSGELAEGHLSMPFELNLGPNGIFGS